MLCGGQLKCTECGHCSDTLDPFMDLSVSFEGTAGAHGAARKVRSVPEALECFTSAERLGSGNEWRCGGCKKPREAEKRLTVFKV